MTLVRHIMIFHSVCSDVIGHTYYDFQFRLLWWHWSHTLWFSIQTALMTLVTHIMIFHSDSSGDIGHTHDFQFRLLWWNWSHTLWFSIQTPLMTLVRHIMIFHSDFSDDYINPWCEEIYLCYRSSWCWVWYARSTWWSKYSQACIKINNNISDSLGNVKHNEHSVTDVRHLDPGKRQEKFDKTKFYQFVFIRLNSYTVIPVYKGYSREPENVPFMSC